MGDVIRPSRQMVDEIMEKSTIVNDQESNKESVLYSSSSSITPYSEVCELTVLSVNDDGNESWNTAMKENEEEEEEGITMTTIVTTPVVNASYHGSTIEE